MWMCDDNVSAHDIMVCNERKLAALRGNQIRLRSRVSSYFFFFFFFFWQFIDAAGGLWHQNETKNQTLCINREQNKSSKSPQQGEDRVGRHLLILDVFQDWRSDDEWRRVTHQEGRGRWIREGLAMLIIILRVCQLPAHTSGAVSVQAQSVCNREETLCTFTLFLCFRLNTLKIFLNFSRKISYNFVLSRYWKMSGEKHWQERSYWGSNSMRTGSKT